MKALKNGQRKNLGSALEKKGEVLFKPTNALSGCIDSPLVTYFYYDLILSLDRLFTVQHCFLKHL